MKKIEILLVALILFSVTGFSQDKSAKRKVKSLLKEGQFQIDIENYPKAWQIYREILSMDPKNEVAGVNAAMAVFKLNYPMDSAYLLAGNLSGSKAIDAKYYLARIKHQQRSFDEAIVLLAEYNGINPNKRAYGSNEINYLIGICTNAKNFTSNPHRSVIKNMGENINSTYADYVPVIVPDESALYFTSKREGSSNNKLNGDNNYLEDVYVSYKEGGQWKKAINAGPPINTETNDGCVAISPDGQRMIIYRTASDIETGDLYTTQIGINNKWEPLNLMSKEINSDFIETSACFSNDTSEIYFTSNRPGGIGGKDIYRIKKLPNGKWSPPFNLGPTVNTIYDEEAPFLHPDGVTLYYSSRGHNTMGEYDVFKSTWDSQHNEFTRAENLGYPINDVGNDIFFVLSVDGQRGYYSSIKQETYGGLDIYQIDTRFGDNDLKVEEGVALIEDVPGRVKITLIDAETNKETGYFYSNPSNGKFILILNPLKAYKAVVEADDCFTLNKDIKPLAFEMKSHDLEFKLKKTNAQ